MSTVLDAPTPDLGARHARAGRHRPWALLAVLVPTVLVGLHALTYGAWEVDDAGITFAYARSVATGAGPVLQPGLPPVEGWSNPAWLALLVLGRWLGLFDHGTWFGVPDYVAYPKLLGLLCVAGALAAFHAAAATVSRRPALVTLLTGTVLAAVPSFVIWCVSGLENGLLVLAVAGLAAVLVRARAALATVPPAVACGLLAALAALTRPEGLIYAGAFPIAALLLVRRGTWLATVGAAAASVGAFAVPVGAYLAWRLATFGQWLPTTAVAKSQGLPTVAGFARIAELVAYAGWLAVLVGVLLVGAGLGRPQLRDGLLVLLVPLGLALAAFGVLVPDWMGEYRFATPVWALGAFAVALAAVEVVGDLRGRGRVLVAAAAALVAVLSGTAWASAAATFRANPTAPMCLIVVNTGHEFNGYMEVLGLREATFFAPEIGGGALTGRALLVDGAGLAEPTIARFWADWDITAIQEYVLADVRPTFVRAHGEFRPIVGLETDGRFLRDYVEIGPTPNNGANWVRRELVPDDATLQRLRAWAREADAADARQRATPRAACGDRLDVGATTI